MVKDSVLWAVGLLMNRNFILSSTDNLTSLQTPVSITSRIQILI